MPFMMLTGGLNPEIAQTTPIVDSIMTKQSQLKYNWHWKLLCLEN